MPENCQLSLFPETEVNEGQKVVNVASVPNRSPFRYPGGKTWLIPTIRKWLRNANQANLIESFCGGGTVGLTAAAENLAGRVTMIEMDDDVACVWKVILSDAEWLANEIISFNLTSENVHIVTLNPTSEKEKAFATIIRNRTNHGGILAPGTGSIKRGENGKGLASRWYPTTLARRIRDIDSYKNKITFIQGDAFDYFSEDFYDDNTYYFIDPPYTVAGKRLYTHNEINHELLFEKASKLKCHYLMTYDLCDYVISLANKYGMQYRTIPMQTTHLITKDELLISNDFSWLTD